MRKITIRVVAEGKTDQLSIKELAKAYLAKQPEINFDIEFIEEQPTSDKTSEGGWGLVYKWCLSNPPRERNNIYFDGGLFADDMSGLTCDALLIHLDSDICENIGDLTSISPVPSRAEPPETRGVFIKRVIEEWLWPDDNQKTDNHIVVPAVESIEAWLVAGLSDDDNEPESNHEIQKRLAELDHIVVRKTAVPASLSKPKKNLSNYQKILAVAKQKPEQIAAKCPHFKTMVDDIFVFANSA